MLFCWVLAELPELLPCNAFSKNVFGLYIGNRSPGRLKEMLKMLSAIPGGKRVKTFDLKRLPDDLPEEGIMVNATSLGLNSYDSSPIDVCPVASDMESLRHDLSPGSDESVERSTKLRIAGC